MVRGLVTDSSASKQEASSRSDGSKSRVHPSGLRGVEQQEVSGGQASLRIKGAGYRNRERDPDRARARGSSAALTSLGGLEQRHPSCPLAVFLLVLVLELSRSAGAGVTIRAAVVMVLVPLLVALMLGPGCAHRQGREGEEGRGARGRERGSDSGPSGCQRRWRRRRQEQRLNRAWDG